MIYRIALLLVILLTTACAGTFKSDLKPGFSPSEPLRVAVLPFFRVDDKGEVVEEKEGLLIDKISVLSSELKDPPTKVIRGEVVIELAKSSFDLVSPVLIDLDLPHHGFAKEDGTLDLKKLKATDPKDICEKFLDCDAVLIGTVPTWSRRYYGLQSVNNVGVTLDLISARDRKVLFHAEGEDSDSRGLSKGPTGLRDLFIEPIKGLDSEIIVQLSRRIIKQLIAPLERMKIIAPIATPPPSIYASSHDGIDNLLPKSRPLIVVGFGTPGQVASFSLGTTVENIPMVERSPGHYYGEYFPLPQDSFKEQPVIISLRDTFGRATTQTISKGPITVQ